MRVFSVIQKFTILLIFCALGLGVFTPSSLKVQAQAASQTFDPEIVLEKDELYMLPVKFDSIAAIQTYLEDQRSVLATYQVPVSFEADDDLISQDKFSTKPYYLQPFYTTSPYRGKSVSVAELIWLMSQTDFGNGCGISQQEVCFDNRTRAINPAFILALIQKESGLVFGANAIKPATDPNTQFLLDRTVGYFCFESSDPSQSCYDQNASWRFYKGFFRQIYYGVRFLRVWDSRCSLGGSYAYTNSMGAFALGNQVNINNKLLVLRSSMACAFYIYTPNLSGQQLYWSAFRQISSFTVPKTLGQEDLTTLNALSHIICQQKNSPQNFDCGGLLPLGYLPPKQSLKLGFNSNNLSACSFEFRSGQYAFSCPNLTAPNIGSNNLQAALGDSRTFKTDKTLNISQPENTFVEDDLRSLAVICNNQAQLSISNDYTCIIDLPSLKNIGDSTINISFINPSDLSSKCVQYTPTKLICAGVRTGPQSGDQILFGQLNGGQKIAIKTYLIGLTN